MTGELSQLRHLIPADPEADLDVPDVFQVHPRPLATSPLLRPRPNQGRM
ncbi:MAG: hypothetical protein PVF45_03670 [Anaerolineae bacterium]